MASVLFYTTMGLMGKSNKGVPKTKKTCQPASKASGDVSWLAQKVPKAKRVAGDDDERYAKRIAVREMFVMLVDRCSKNDADVEVAFSAIMKRSSKSGASGRMIDATLKFKSVSTIENLDIAYLVDFIAMVTDLTKNMIFAAAELDPEAPLKLFLRLTEWHGTMKIPQCCIIKAVCTKVSVERIDSMWEASELKNLKMKLIGAGGTFDF